MYKRRENMRNYIIVITSILLLAVNANAAFPVDEAGIAAYVNLNKSINLLQAADVFAPPIAVNETYLIGQISGWSGKVYVGADGWVIAYIPNGTLSSNLISWNGFASNPNVNNATNMLEDSIRRVSEAVGVNFSLIKSNIQYYDFIYPNATHMTIAVETQAGIGTNEFYLLVPSNKTVYESSYSYYGYCNYCSIGLILDKSTYLENEWTGSGGYSRIISYNLSRDILHSIGVKVGNSGYIANAAGVAWVFMT